MEGCALRSSKEKSSKHLRIPVTETEHSRIMWFVKSQNYTFADFARGLIFEEIDRMAEPILTTPGRPNPEFREDWETIHDEAHERRVAALDERDALGAMSRERPLTQAEEDRILELGEIFDREHLICLRCLSRYRHRTFEDAVAWLNKNFYSRDPVSIPDVSPFNDVVALMNEVTHIYWRPRQIADAASKVMRLAAPDELVPFNEAGRCRRIEMESPRPTWAGHVLLVIDEVGGHLHVAMQTDGTPGFVRGEVEVMDTFLRSEFERLSRRRWFGRTTQRPVTFYTYTPPTNMHDERFGRLELVRSRHPAVPGSAEVAHDFDCVPAAVRPSWLPGGLAEWEQSRQSALFR